MIDITLDSSQIKTYLSCPRKWELAHKEHLVLSGASREALNKGTIMHKMLEFFYLAKKDGLSPLDAGEEAVIKFIASKEAELVDSKTSEFLIQRFRMYVITYQNNDFEPLGVEIGFSHIFYEDEFKRYILEGKIDLLAREKDEIPFIDHKTQGRFMNLYPLTPQFLTYAMVSKAKRALYNIIGLQKEINVNTFRRVPVLFEEHHIHTWKWQVMKIFDTIYQTTNHNFYTGFPQNFGECGGAFGSNPCQFTGLCELNPDNVELINNLKAFKYEKVEWRPWNVEEEIA
jgi:hypothetical protein